VCGLRVGARLAVGVVGGGGGVRADPRAVRN
jgi:hypothetical protein